MSDMYFLYTTPKSITTNPFSRLFSGVWCGSDAPGPAATMHGKLGFSFLCAISLLMNSAKSFSVLNLCLFKPEIILKYIWSVIRQAFFISISSFFVFIVHISALLPSMRFYFASIFETFSLSSAAFLFFTKCSLTGDIISFSFDATAFFRPFNAYCIKFFKNHVFAVFQCGIFLNNFFRAIGLFYFCLYLLFRV